MKYNDEVLILDSFFDGFQGIVVDKRIKTDKTFFSEPYTEYLVCFDYGVSKTWVAEYLLKKVEE